MFGFLNPLTRTERYRRAYARCAQHHRRHYGFRALPFLSYESVFIYVCWLDAAGMSAADESEIGRFCSAASLVLAQTKLEDEIRDGPSTLARAVYSLLATDFRSARHYFSEVDPAFEATIREAIDRHLALERGGESLPMDVYARHTAESFGYVFSLLARLPGVHTSAEVFGALGASVASALIACDCVIDFDRDRRSCTFNPLGGLEDIDAACSYAEASLTNALEIAETAFGAGSLSVETIAGVQARVTPRLKRFRGSPQQSHIFEVAHAIGSPVTSHIDASSWSELRDKVVVTCGVVAGVLLDCLVRAGRAFRGGTG